MQHSVGRHVTFWHIIVSKPTFITLPAPQLFAGKLRQLATAEQNKLAGKKCSEVKKNKRGTKEVKT